ncbi:hypothetical protein ZYGR_0AF04600 [Zygosaccharomyces rouxii]|uniref:Uncharacterized protein n=1 Tax=Zygosaccharomyces rouxii TaxID=4956 RepID=A0A1Q3A8I8_ZYGRO|nr:hypothetical protein ZYGR_0AF04600 [Zygosaccharomyces rouxii]
MYSTASSVRPVPTAEEEEETDTASYRYVPRTLQQGGPFYGSAIQGKFTEHARDDDRNEFPKNLGLRKSKTTAEGYPRKISRSRLHRAPTDDFSGRPHNLSAAYQYEDLSNNHESDNESAQSHSFHSTPAFGQHPRRVDSDDIDIKSIHGEDHYGKLETTPIADNQDKLWTQIDALDDVKKLASSVNLYESFPPGFEEQLSKLRQAHSQLLSMMRDRDALLDEDKNFNGTEIESGRDYDVGINKTITGNLSSVRDHTGGNGEANGANNLGADTKRPNTSAGTGTGAGTGANLEANGNVNTSVSSTKSLRPNGRRKSSATPSMTRLDEDKYVQEMIGIIKQLRA